MTVVEPALEPTRTPKLVVAVALACVIAAAVALWGPVARGLHEESVERWCTQRVDFGGIGAVLHADRDAWIDGCVERALGDPDYTRALRASL